MSSAVLDCMSDRDFAAAGFDGPGVAGEAVLDGIAEIVEGDGGADVARDAVEDVADFPVPSFGCFEDEMFLAVHDWCGGGKIQELDARLRIFSGDGFVAEVDAKAVWCGFADDAREDECGE